MEKITIMQELFALIIITAMFVTLFFAVYHFGIESGTMPMGWGRFEEQSKIKKLENKIDQLEKEFNKEIKAKSCHH